MDNGVVGFTNLLSQRFVFAVSGSLMLPEAADRIDNRSRCNDRAPRHGCRHCRHRRRKVRFHTDSRPLIAMTFILTTTQPKRGATR